MFLQVLLISIPHFKSINFYQNRPKIKLFLQIQIFRAMGAIPETVPPLQISGYVPESNHVFVLLIFMPPEFSLMPHFKRINFYQN